MGSFTCSECGQLNWYCTCAVKQDKKEKDDKIMVDNLTGYCDGYPTNKDSDIREIAVAMLEVTPNCINTHGSLSNALTVAFQRARDSVLDVSRHECNNDATYVISVKLRRPLKEKK